MKIAILTSGRFHVLDLARELDRRGHDVRFYSLVPPWRTRRHGLPLRNNRWLGPALGPLWLAYRGLSRLPRPELGTLAHRALTEALDRTAAILLEPCDVFITMSGMGLHTLRRARRLGAHTIVERGSMHIEAQRDILAANRLGAIPDWMVQRELAEYAEADHISIPSLHAEQSFRERGHEHGLFRNPYGVSLTEFSPTPEPARRQILMVGTWSWQKGADTLTEAYRLLKQRPDFHDVALVHVGPTGDVPLPTLDDPPRNGVASRRGTIGDIPLPTQPRSGVVSRLRISGFTHHAPVPQAELQRFYADATVAVLPSRQDGFGMVLCQALACGVPIVASTRTGGPDLAALLSTPNAVRLVPPESPQALADALADALTQRPAPGTTRALLNDTERRAMSWEGYGRRWDAFLRALPAHRDSR